MGSPTHYEILGVDQNASDKDIKAAYRKLALKLHPDKCPSDKKDEYEAEFKKVSVAYDVLSNPKKRQDYDLQLQGGPSLQDMFKGGGGGGNPFENIFNFFQGTRDVPTVVVNLTLEDVVNGVVKSVKYMRIEFCNTCLGKGYESESDVAKCNQCNGTGQVDRVLNMGFFQQVFREMCHNCQATGKMILKPCRVCHGKLTFEKEATVKIKISPGVKHNDSIVLKNKGNQIAQDMYTDLNIVVKVAKHKVYERISDKDLKTQVTISLSDALCGFEKELQFLDGTSFTVSSKEIVNPETVTIIENKGVYKNGKLHVMYNIEFPKELGTFLNDVYKKNMDSIDVLLKKTTLDDDE